MAELPDAIALNDEPKDDDQRRGLERRKDMQPGRRGDEPERETGDTRDECGSEAGGDEQPDLDGAHGWSHDLMQPDLAAAGAPRLAQPIIISSAPTSAVR